MGHKLDIPRFSEQSRRLNPAEMRQYVEQKRAKGMATGAHIQMAADEHLPTSMYMGGSRTQPHQHERVFPSHSTVFTHSLAFESTISGYVVVTSCTDLLVRADIAGLVIELGDACSVNKKECYYDVQVQHTLQQAPAMRPDAYHRANALGWEQEHLNAAQRPVRLNTCYCRAGRFWFFPPVTDAKHQYTCLVVAKLSQRQADADSLSDPS
jgi:hypothetical protein